MEVRNDFSVYLANPARFEGYLINSGGALVLTSAFATGYYCSVAGDVVNLNESIFTVGTGDNIMAADGTDSGAACAASTFYYVYLNGAAASYRPSTLAICASAPILNSDGLYYLGATGNEANSRFCGVVYTSAVPLFEDTETKRHIHNFYNRQHKQLKLAIGYTNDNAQTTITVNNAAYGALNGHVVGTDCVSYVHFGGFADVCWNYFIGAQGAAGGAVGFGDDSITQPAVAQGVANSDANLQGCLRLACALDSASAGRREFNPLAYTNSVNMTFRADLARNGAAADPPACLINGYVLS